MDKFDKRTADYRQDRVSPPQCEDADAFRLFTLFPTQWAS